MDRFFRISERGSSLSNEIIGGLTTFLAMAYIIAVNPLLMGPEGAGLTFEAALTATCFGAAIMTAAMGLIANRPIALASGMGINAVVAYSMCGATGAGLDWRIAMAVVFIEGIAILLLVISGLRKAVMEAIPADLRRAIDIGIGLFIAFVGVSGGGLVVSDSSTILALGDMTSPAVAVSCVSILAAMAFQALNVKGGLLISIVIATLVGIPLGVTPMPTSLDFSLDFSAFGAPFQTVPGTGELAIVQALLQPALLLFAFSLLMSDFFDTMGSVVAVAEQGEFMDENEMVEDIQPILLVDSAAAAVGGLFGASSITTYVESASGAAAGARTGLSSIVVAVLFAGAAFFSPIIAMVTSSATCGALVVVGYLMMSEVGGIQWSRIEYAFPAFAIIFSIPMTYSITNGIGFGFISYCAILIFQGKIREIKPLMWIATIAFLAMFVLA